MPTLLLAVGLLRRVADAPLLYVFLWCGLVALSVLLVVLLWSRWGQSRPLYKCAVLSLLVHVLLACLAMTVRIVVGDGGTTIGPPIRVRLIEEPPPTPVAMVPPPLFEPEPPEVVEEEVDAEVEEPQVDDEPAEETPAEPEPPVAETPKPEEDPFEIVETEADEPPPPTPEVQQETSESEVAKSDIVEPESTQATPPSEPVAANPVATESEPIAPVEPASPTPPAPPSVPPPYVDRTRQDRQALVEEQGGSRETEAAVAAALAWLADAQSSDGRWDASRFGSGQEQGVLGHDRHGAGANADTGITALALLAFLGAGHTHWDGDYRTTVRAGLEFLLRSQASDGSLAGPSALYAQMYCHAMATFALAEAQAMTGDERLEPALRRALAYSLRAQHPATGGWRYRVGDTGDTSQLGWQMMALWSAQQAGIQISPQIWTGTERFLRSVGRGSCGGLASYRSDGPASTSMTAEALYCRLLLAEAIGGQLDDTAAEEAAEQLLAHRPQSERINLYYWYYATLALHHRHLANERAEAAWRDWNSDLTGVLLTAQVSDGPEAGSWSANTVWGGYGGRVYSTAMATLCLEVYYRYVPAPQVEPWIATRPGSERAVQ